MTDEVTGKDNFNLTVAFWREKEREKVEKLDEILKSRAKYPGFLKPKWLGAFTGKNRNILWLRIEKEGNLKRLPAFGWQPFGKED